MDVSIIIVNYNTASLLCDAIGSVIEKTESIDYEIIVVDNNSSDDSENIISEKYGKSVRYIKLAKNIGFGRANNEGVKIAKGRNIFLLNPDTLLCNNAVKILSDYLDDNKNVGVCGGNIFDKNLNPAYSFMPVFPSILWEIDTFFNKRLFNLIYGQQYWFNKTGKPKEVAHITGADMMVRKNIMLQTKGFDPDFFMYEEETELIYRIKKIGYKIMSVPQSEIIHLEGKSFSSNFDRLKKIISARNLFYKKTHNSIYHFFADLIYYSTAISRIVVFKLLNNKEKLEHWLFIIKNIK
jgi:GT2 family glycosyltransferase